MNTMKFKNLTNVLGMIQNARNFVENTKNYNVTTYPDGQISVHVSEFVQNFTHRINSYQDLFVIKSISDIYKNNNIPLPKLFIPCLFGQQSDRRFHYRESFDLKLICDFINSCDFEEVGILDPHSDIGPALINRSKVVSSKNYVKEALVFLPDDTVLVSPDAGAYKKVFKYAEEFDRELVAANKFRDREGAITLSFTGDVAEKTCLIVDDMILGGRTFIELSKQLMTHGANKVYLYVTHGKFSNGFDELKKHIQHIYCTNSYKDISLFDTMSTFDGFENHKNYVTQFKVV